jgi:CO dehydrogenase/acetyl-CoA synthase gamma subunit (corrinoid Fe-S protein)
MLVGVNVWGIMECEDLVKRMDLSMEEINWLLRMCDRALLLTGMNLQTNTDDPEKLKILVKKLEVMGVKILKKHVKQNE